MRTGILLKVELFVPYDPQDLKSLQAAAATADKASTLEGLRTLPDDVQVEGVSHSTVNSRGKRAKAAAEAVAAKPGLAQGNAAPATAAAAKGQTANHSKL